MEKEIVVNGHRQRFIPDEMTYEMLVALAGYPEGSNPTAVYHWRGRRSDGERNGTLYKGKSVKVDNGMIFTIVHTGSA